MELLWGVAIVGLGLLAWGGQVVTWLAPEAATRLSLTEAEDAVDAVYWADLRGEARWDAITLWTLPLAGLLLVVGHQAWAWLGLFAAGIYVYLRAVASSPAWSSRAELSASANRETRSYGRDPAGPQRDLAPGARSGPPVPA